jgi:Thaumatin family
MLLIPPLLSLLVVAIPSSAENTSSIPLPDWLGSIPKGILQLTPGKSIIIKNNCPFNVWPGYVGTNSLTGMPIWGPSGTPSPAGSKTPLKPGSSMLNLGSYQILEVFDGAAAIRVWPRTGCKTNWATGRWECEIGDCGNEVNEFDGTCFMGSGRGGISLAEFTFTDNNGNVFYDLSLVDGYTLPIKITVVGNPIPTPGQGEFACGNPKCDPKQDFSECPPELKKLNSSGNVIGCFAIHQAAADDEMKAGKYGTYLSQIWNTPELWSRTACTAV